MPAPDDLNTGFAGQYVYDWAVKVRVWRKGRLWRLEYDCKLCGRVHMHSGGDGPRPVGGIRYSQCPLAPRLGETSNVNLVLPQR